MSFLWGALKVIFLLGTLITIHEFGHFIVAKACGMRVLKFSIGFGPKLLKKQGKETEYSLRLLPLGGFVQLEGEDENSDDPRAFNRKPAWQRILVLSAGVFINIMFALLIYLGINMNINFYRTAKIDSVSSSEIEMQSRLEKGQEILKINGTKIYNYYDITKIISEAENDNFIFEVKNIDGKKEKILVEIPKKELGYIGVSFSDKRVYSVLENTAGERAGLKPNDEILAINGLIKETIDEYLNIIQANPNNQIEFKINRDGNEIILTATPEVIQKRIFNVDFVIAHDLGFIENIYYAWNETMYYLRANVVGFAEIFTGKTENVEVQGIVGISKKISATERAIEFFYMMSAISLSLGIMNLLPIPGLDGGKIVFTLVEMIRRKPISSELEGTLTLAGFGVLILLMIVVTVGDVVKLF